MAKEYRLDLARLQSLLDEIGRIDSHLGEDAIMALALNDVSPEEQARFSAHLEECAECRDEVAQAMAAQAAWVQDQEAQRCRAHLSQLLTASTAGADQLDEFIKGDGPTEMRVKAVRLLADSSDPAKLDRLRQLVGASQDSAVRAAAEAAVAQLSPLELPTPEEREAGTGQVSSSNLPWPLIYEASQLVHGRQIWSQAGFADDREPATAVDEDSAVDQEIVHSPSWDQENSDELAFWIEGDTGKVFVTVEVPGTSLVGTTLRCVLELEELPGQQFTAGVMLVRKGELAYGRAEFPHLILGRRVKAKSVQFFKEG